MRIGEGYSAMEEEKEDSRYKKDALHSKRDLFKCEKDESHFSRNCLKKTLNFKLTK